MSARSDDDPRFWIVIQPERRPFSFNNVAVADEEKGGIIAYFSDEDDAELFRAAKEKADV